VVQTLLTGALKPNAIEKLHAFALERFFDTEIGGYGSEVFPKGALLLNARTRAAEKYGVEFAEDATVYIADSSRDVAAARMGGARSVGWPAGARQPASCGTRGRTWCWPTCPTPRTWCARSTG
jgi:phosphoglycolate phosphatase-like HAD superfamily hydrolase